MKKKSLTVDIVQKMKDEGKGAKRDKLVVNKVISMKKQKKDPLFYCVYWEEIYRLMGFKHFFAI